MNPYEATEVAVANVEINEMCPECEGTGFKKKYNFIDFLARIGLIIFFALAFLGSNHLLCELGFLPESDYQWLRFNKIFHWYDTPC